MASIWSDANKALARKLVADGLLSEQAIRFMTTFGSESTDLSSIAKYFTSEPTSFMQGYLNSAPPIIARLMHAPDLSKTRYATFLANVLPAVPILNKVGTADKAGHVLVQQIELNTTPAEYMPISVAADELRAIKSTTKITMAPTQARFSVEARTLEFRDGREYFELMKKGLSTQISNKVIKAQTGALFESSSRVMAYTPMTLSCEEYSSALLSGSCPLGIFQQEGSRLRAFLDRVTNALEANCGDVTIAIGGGGAAIKSTALYGFLEASALSLASFATNAHIYKEVGYGAEFIQDEGSEAYYFKGIRFARVPPMVGTKFEEFNTEAVRGEHAISGKVTDFSSPEAVIRDSAIHYRSLEGTTATVETIALKEALLRVHQFSSPTPSDSSGGPIPILSSPLENVSKRAQEAGISTPVVGEEAIVDVMMTPTRSAPDGSPQTMATPAIGAVHENYASAAFVHSASKSATAVFKSILRQHCDREHMDHIRAMLTAMRQSRHPHSIEPTSFASKFALACSGATANANAKKYGCFGLPPLTDNSGIFELGSVVAPSSGVIPCVGNMQWSYYFASLFNSNSLSADEKKWAKLYGEKDFNDMMGIYFRGVEAVEACLSLSSREFVGSTADEACPTLSPKGAPEGSGFNEDTGIANRINAATAFCAPVLGAAPAVYVNTAAKVADPTDADLLPIVEVIVGAVPPAFATAAMLEAFKVGAKASTIRDFVAQSKNTPLLGTTQIRREVWESINAAYAGAGAAREVERLSMALAYFKACAGHITTTAQIIKDLNNTLSTEKPRVAADNNQFGITTLALGVDMFTVGVDVAKSNALIVRPHTPGDQSSVYLQTIDAANISQMVHYGKRYLAGILRTKTSPNAPTEREINATYDWTAHGFLTGTAYACAIKSVAFVRRILEELGSNTRGSNMLSYALDRASTVIYLSTRMASKTLSHLASIGVPLPVRVVLALPAVLTEQAAVVLAKGGVGLTPIGVPHWRLPKNLENAKVGVVLDLHMGAAVVHPHGVFVLPDAVLKGVGGHVGVEPYNMDLGKGAAYLLVGQSTRDPDVISIGGRCLSGGAISNTGLQRPSFDAAIMAALVLPFTHTWDYMLASRISQKTTPYKVLRAEAAKARHCAFDIRLGPSYVLLANGEYRLRSPGVSTMSCIGPGTSLRNPSVIKPLAAVV